ncbi:MAG: UrcA family protein [Pseudomonadota bacterium]
MKTTIATVTALIVAAATPAFAQDVSVRIDRDLLDTQAGRQVVYQELENAARRACRADLSQTRQMNKIASCSSELVDSMVSNLGDSRVSAIHTNSYVVAGQ